MSTFKHSKIKLLISFIFILLFFGGAKVLASDVLVETETEIGRGILREVGGNCFVYTPQHVAENSAGFVFVSSPQIRDAEASVLTFFPVDLALLKLPKEAEKMCSKASWQDNGNRVNAILEIQKDGILSLRKKSGALSEIQVRFINKDLHSYFYIEPEQPNQQILQGMSGSIIYVGTYPVGMLVAVTDGIGKVLRIDTIANISKTVLDKYATQLEKIASTSSDKSAFPSLAKKSQSKELSSTLFDTEFSGSIAKSGIAEHRFISRGHTAYKLKLKRQSSNAKVYVEVLSPSGERLASSGGYQTKREKLVGFGTIDSGEHIIRVKGVSGAGTYHMTLEEVAAPEQLVGEANVLADGISVSGYIARKTFADYRLVTRGHSAYKLSLKRQSESAKIVVEVLSPSGERLATSGVFYTKKDKLVGLGTIDSGEHIIRVKGIDGVGTFHMTLEEVATPEQLVGEANVLEDGVSVSGYIAGNTHAEYRLLARGHAAYKLSLKRQSENAKVYVEVLSPSGERLASSGVYYTKKDKLVGFGTVDSGEHIIRIKGVSGVGTYHMTLVKAN